MFDIIVASPSPGARQRAASGTDGKICSEAPLPTGARVAELQFELIRDVAERGPCVIVGRCANHLLRERDDVLDVFIHAGEEYRLRRAMERLRLPEKQARKVLKSTDKARRAYYRNYTGCEWYDPDLYHMVLNPDRMGEEACVGLICDTYLAGQGGA